MNSNKRMSRKRKELSPTMHINHLINVKRMGMIRIFEHLKSILRIIFLNYLIKY